MARSLPAAAPAASGTSVTVTGTMGFFFGGSSFNDETTQTARDPLFGAAGSHPSGTMGEAERSLRAANSAPKSEEAGVSGS
jgi:hypothetical protein